MESIEQDDLSWPRIKGMGRSCPFIPHSGPRVKLRQAMHPELRQGSQGPVHPCVHRHPDALHSLPPSAGEHLLPSAVREVGVGMLLPGSLASLNLAFHTPIP